MLKKYRERRRERKERKLFEKLNKLETKTGGVVKGETQKRKNPRKSKQEKDFENAIANKISERARAIDDKKSLLSSVPKEAGRIDFRKKANIITKLKNKFFPGRSILIQMEMRTGSHRQFLVNEKHNSFDFVGGTYILDPDLKFWVEDSKCYSLRFHQDFCLPIKPEFDLTEIRQAIESLGTVEVENSTNPTTLKRLIDSKIAEQVMKGQALDEMIKSVKTMLMVTMIVGILHCALFVIKSGMLKEIKIPGLF